MKKYVKEMGISLFTIVINVCLYMLCALQFINREVSVKLLFFLMSIWAMTVLLAGLIVEIVRTEIREKNKNTIIRRNFATIQIENGSPDEEMDEECEIWEYILSRTVCFVSLILTCAMTALSIVAYLILEAERRYISMEMGLVTLPVIITVIKLWKITKKEITIPEISFELDR